MLLRRLVFVVVGLVVLGLPGGAWAAEGCPNEALREAQGSGFLAECRAYEMVSPVEKGGGDVITNPMRTRSSLDGNALVFSSDTAFADAQGTSEVVEYGARRGADGWTTHAITPPQDPYGSFLGPPLNQTQLMGALSGDLSTGVMYALRPLTAGAPNVAEVPNLYLRRDILSGPPGQYQLLSNSVNLLEPYTDLHGPSIFLAGASADFSHVIFESRSNLTADASGEAWKLYESEEGRVRLAGVLPGGEPALGSQAGRGNEHEVVGVRYTPNMISRDGSRVFFTDTETGKIYMRENHSTTVQLNVSERAIPDAPGSAELWSVTPDGSQVLFTTRENLIEDGSERIDIGGGEPNLYRYDVNAPAGQHLTLISKDHEQGGEAFENRGVTDVMGLSDDGSYVYFHTGPNRLLGSQPELLPEAALVTYAWHNGTLGFVGQEETGTYEDAYGPGEEASLSNAGSDIRVTSAGVLVYATGVPQTSYDTTCSAQGHCDEVYVFDPAVGHVVCASCDQSGARPLGGARFTYMPSATTPGIGRNQYLGRAVTDDGGRVFFDSPDPLVSRDTNGKFDVYEYVVASGEVHLISSGQSSSDSWFEDASTDGSNVFFTTRQQLVSQDLDGSSDVYDARIGGGLAAQERPPVVGCVGDACQGVPGTPPGFGSPSSAALSGVGNLPAVVPGPVVKVVKHKAKPRPKHKARPKHKSKRKKRRGRARKARGLGKSVSRRAGR